MEGDLDDVEILYNANSKAPHIAQNLRGDFVFSQNEARICLFGQNPAGLALTAEQAVLAKADTRQIAVTVEPCNPDQLLSYDIVATQRNAFLQTKRDDALALIKTIEDDDFRKFAEVTAADLNKAADAERAQIEKIKANVADGAPDGFGVVLLKTESSNLCLAVGGELPSHRQLLLRDEHKLNLEMQTEAVIKDTNINDAFVDVQKRQCGAVYASASDLKTLTAALTRNDIPYVFSSLWILPTDVEREVAELAAPITLPKAPTSLSQAIAAANRQLDDAASFVKEHADSPNLFDYIERIGSLKAAIKKADPDEIEHKSTELANAFSHDKDYQQHLADLAEAQKKREAQYLLDAIRRGKNERDFILDYIGKNPTADATPALAALFKQLDPALQRADLNQLQPLVDKIDVAIREDNLESAFIAAREANKSPEKNTETAPTVTPNAPPAVGLPTTEKNRFLVEGDLDDVEILYNANSKAPHIAQNLRGDFVFSQNEARICLFGQNPAGLALTAEQAVLAKADTRQIAVTVEPCNPDQLLSYDIVATQRNAFLQTKRDDALALIKTIEDDDFRKFAEVTAADLNKAADAERAQIEKIKANVADGAPDGFGVVLLKTESSNLCLAVGGELPSHRQLLLRDEHKLNLEMQTEAVIKDTNINDAFVDVQKRQCGAVYASASDLKTLTAALTRNDIPYVFSSLWILPTDVEREVAELAEKTRIAAQEETERAERNADQERLRSKREEERSVTQRAQQDVLRQKFGNSAKAAADALSSEIAALTKYPRTKDDEKIAILFPEFGAWLAGKLSDHWEVMKIDTDVQDFGTSSFKSRALDTIFARITFHLEHRMLGEYKDFCFIFGRINDTEFSMRREPAFAACDDEVAIKTWQAGHQFKSEWFASN